MQLRNLLFILILMFGCEQKNSPELIRFAQNPLSEAIKQDIPLDQLKTIIESNEKYLNASDSSGFSPIHYAAMGGDSKIVQFLIDEGASVNTEVQAGQGYIFDGHTPVDIATEFNFIEIVSILNGE